jgi:L-threonylcarbamoyladenylate synthase
MMTVYKITADTPAAAAATEGVRRAAEVLRRGGLVAFPTETVYGLGANALEAAAVARIFATKGRPSNNPLIVHVADAEQARELTATWPSDAQRLAEHFWPGPLTLVLPKRAAVPAIVTAGADTVAVRVPAHPVALGLLQAVALPLAAPSANRANQLSPTTAAHVLAGLGPDVEAILNGGATSGGLESTVLDLTRQPARLLRPGLVAPSDIEAIIGSIARRDVVAPDGNAPLPSPGTQRRHYAPRAMMECYATGGRERVAELAAKGLRIAWLPLGNGTEAPSISGANNVTIRAMPSHPVEYSRILYAVLHELDNAGVGRIVIDLPPEEDAWLAVRDRLRRGSASVETN